MRLGRLNSTPVIANNICHRAGIDATALLVEFWDSIRSRDWIRIRNVLQSEETSHFSIICALWSADRKSQSQHRNRTKLHFVGRRRSFAIVKVFNIRKRWSERIGVDFVAYEAICIWQKTPEDPSNSTIILLETTENAITASQKLWLKNIGWMPSR